MTMFELSRLRKFLLVGEEGGVVGMVKHPLVNDLRCPF